MSTKLVQKHFLKGSREFEIVDDAINVRIKTPFKEEKLTVVLTVLNPEPVVNGPFLDFHSRVKCGPLLSLLLDKPNTGEFKTFVDELKRRAREEYNTFAGLKAGSKPEGLAGNVYDEPPDFDEPAKKRSGKTGKPISITSVDSAIEMLKQHLDVEEIKPFAHCPGNTKRRSGKWILFRSIGKSIRRYGATARRCFNLRTLCQYSAV